MLEKPSHLATRILQRILDENIRYSAMQDFKENYDEIAKAKGALSARIWYWTQIVSLLPSFFKNSFERGTAMFKNYFKIALRNIARQKTYSIINLAGLSIGITLCLLIFLYVQDEINFDKIHENLDNIYRITYHRAEEAASESASAPFPLAGALQQEFPGVEDYVQLYFNWGGSNILYNDKAFSEKYLVMASPSILDVFTIPFVKGDPNTALDGPNNVIITEEIAQKYFGDEDPVGKVLRYANNTDLTVTGVFKDISDKSHLKFELILPWQFLRNMWPTWSGFEDNWTWNATKSYLLLKDKSVVNQIESQFPAFVQRTIPEKDRQGLSYHLEPMKDIYLYSTLGDETKSSGNILYVYIFSTIAVLALLIACINFMNLATARSARRAKEVGMRKVMGAYRYNLVNQFLGEALMLSLLAVVIGILMTEAVLPAFNGLTGKSLDIQYWGDPVIIPVLLFVAIFVGFLSGSYPAVFLSAFHPIRAIKGSLVDRVGKGVLRKALVVSQFAVSTILLIAIGIIFNQLNFIRNKPLGFSTQFVMVNALPNAKKPQYDTLRNMFLQSSSVEGVSSVIGGMPGESGATTFRFMPEGYTAAKHKIMLLLWVGFDFTDLFELEVIEGRGFSTEFLADSANSFIINETAAKQLGWEGNAVGKTIKQIQFGGGIKTATVVGVVKDFNTLSLHNEMLPMVLTPGGYNFAVKVKPENITAAMSHLESSWKKIAPEVPFDYYFLDESVDAQYRNEKRLSEVIQYFTILTVFIACLGLLGLASFTAEQRTKEIGIRKVLGGTISNITTLLSREFTVLVLLSNIIAWPVAYYVMDRWLQNFAYRADIGYPIFIMAAVAMLVIAFGTVSYQTIKAATANPIKSLRYE